MKDVEDPTGVRPLHAATQARLGRELYTVRVFVVEQGKERSLAGLLVRVILVDRSGKNGDLLAEARTDVAGLVHFSAAPTDSPRVSRSVRVQTFAWGSEALLEKIVKLQPAKPEIAMQIAANKLAADEMASRVPLDAWRKELHLSGFSRTLQRALQQRKIGSLADLRQASDVDSMLADLGSADRQTLADLEAHARLQILSKDHRTNQSLVGAGYRDPFAIARKSRGEFAASLKGHVDEVAAGRLHATARGQVQALVNTHTEHATRAANGMRALSGGGVVAPTEEPPCACGCDSAVSPQAYLVDLLDYAVDNVRVKGEEVDFWELERTFGQPFAGLPVDCSFATVPVRQIRLCVEVLHRRNVLLADTDVQAAVNVALTAHVPRAYQAMLQALGTSERALRLARGYEDAAESLGERIGIATDGINVLRLTPDGDALHELTEANLERVFGLPATARDPLSTGAKSGDAAGQLTRWQLRGVRWRRNTDELGRVHVSITKTDGTHQVAFYRDEARTNAHLVATGSSTKAAGPVKVLATNGSGLAGRIEFTYTADDAAITLAAVPELVALQTSHLRTVWLRADHLGTSLAAPLVDPDVVAESDLMRPFARNDAHQFWATRTQELQDKRESLAAQQDITAMLQDSDVLAAPPDLAVWDDIGARLASPHADVVTGAVEDLTAVGEHLTPETFGFLLALLHREDEGQVVEADERDQALDVLVNLFKSGRLEIWRTEEAAVGLTLTAPYFYLAETEPALNPLRTTTGARTAWRMQLERDTAMPLIDPDLVAVTDFTSGPDADHAYQRWESRRHVIGDGRAPGDDDPPRVAGTLFQAVSAVASRATLDRVLTDSDLPASTADPQFHAIGFTPEEVEAVADALADGAAVPVIPQQFGLTGAELRMLFEVRRLDGEADPSDWEHVHHILVQAEKRRFLHPQWLAEERSDGLSLNPDVFRVPSAKLTDLLSAPRLTSGFLRWRADSRRQAAWRALLLDRSGQDQTIADAAQIVAGVAEEATLPVLRDELVKATVSAQKGGASLEERKRWVLNHLLINPFENGCRQTTRVAQGIETIQLMLWGIHTRHLEDDKYSLESAGIFAEEWTWLGSYATWRSAMFTRLYPENLLVPDLRRTVGDADTDPTSLFRAIVKVTTGQTPRPGDPGTEADAQESDDVDAPAIKRVFKILGDTDPLSVETPRIIMGALAPRLRLKNFGESVGPDADVFLVQTSGGFLQLPETPSDVDVNPYYLLVVLDSQDPAPPDYWAQYLTESAFLEDVLYIPLHFAITQYRRGRFEEARHWFGRVYAFDKSPEAGVQGWADPRLETYFRQRSGSGTGIAATDNWLSDSLNPHRIAATRTGADLRFVVLTIIGFLLDYADSEFAKDTTESVPKARELYETARRLLQSEHLGTGPVDCNDMIGTLVSQVGEDEWVEYDVIGPVLDLVEVDTIDPDAISPSARSILVGELKRVLTPTDPPRPRAQLRQDVRDIVARHFAPLAPGTVQDKQLAGRTQIQAGLEYQLTQPGVFATMQHVSATDISSELAAGGLGLGDQHLEDSHRGRWIRAPRFEFCIPRNPLIRLLTLRLEVSQYKLNNCMNVAGQRRELPAYAAATDTSSGLPSASFSSAGQSVATRITPTHYRYRVLIERAQRLVATAQQLEATYLSHLETQDRESYTILRARQDLGMAQASVTLQDLRVAEAVLGQTQAKQQLDRVSAAQTHYQELIDAGNLQDEDAAFYALMAASVAQGLGVILASGAGLAIDAAAGGATMGAGAGLGATAALVASGGQMAMTLSSLAAMRASYERRLQGWEFELELAELDVLIAESQQDLADARHAITLQEQQISAIGAENASDAVNFLSTKFTSTELYAWMSNVVGGIYRNVLQEATVVARLAQRQLAFERQEPELAIVLDDYWSYNDTGAVLRGPAATTDRRGMTGSTRLVQDLIRLDQEAFMTDQRTLQLSKTISLAAHDPVSFARFRETGDLPFSTTFEQFDRDFPGHYLRLIKRLRVSVIALVPPTEGLRATLSSSGISRVVREGPDFAETEIRRDPETIAFTSPINATGRFELQESTEILLPFEGSGVAAVGWNFRMDRAANVVDYRTIADVLVTFDYTARDNDVLRQRVIDRLGNSLSVVRAFSFRQQFADAWYDLHNPELREPDHRMRATFATTTRDFPPNLKDLRIQHVSLYFVRAEGLTDSIDVSHLMFTEAGRAGQVGGSAATSDGLISTRGTNAGSWLAMQGKSPGGKWELRLPDTSTTRSWFRDGDIRDIVLVLDVAGTTPPRAI